MNSNRIIGIVFSAIFGAVTAFGITADNIHATIIGAVFGIGALIYQKDGDNP